MVVWEDCEINVGFVSMMPRRRFLSFVGRGALAILPLSGSAETRSSSLATLSTKRYGVVETKWIDPKQLPNSRLEILHFSQAQDARWTGLMLMPAGARILPDANMRNDIYIIQGSIIEDGVPGPHLAETFLSRVNPEIQAGPQGATLFVYRDHYADAGEQITVSKKDAPWRQGGVPGMRIASLVESYHSLLFVSWAPGTKVPFHDHPWGEEIFVLSGELQDQRGRYPAGTWQRLHPGTGHSPHVSVDTLILLRNGHLG